MIKVYIVRCYMQGCDECGDEYHIVGAFSTYLLAKKADDKHRKYKHLHTHYTDIDEVILDEYRNSYREGEVDRIKTG